MTQHSLHSKDASLRELAARRGLLIGGCVNSAAFEQGLQGNEADYLRVLAEQFNILTPENATKFGPLSPAPGRYDWRIPDAMFDFAAKHGMQVRVHTGIWHHQTPAWLTEEAYSPEQIEQIACEHLSALGQRYGDRMYCWDVVNEAIDDKPPHGLRDSIWKRGAGDDYVAKAFQWAHEAAPNVKLVYNEYGTTEGGSKADAVYEKVTAFKLRGVPIHAVGFQTHLLGGESPDRDAIVRNLQRFADLGLELHVTEMDVAIAPYNGTMDEKLARQAEVYRLVLEACLAVKGFTVFQLWGFTDRYSWVPSFKKCDDAALIFDTQYRPKPAFFAMREALGSGR